MATTTDTLSDLYGTSTTTDSTSTTSTDTTTTPATTTSATTAAVLDPYVRNLALSALQSGLSSGNLIATDAYTAEADRQAELARQSVTATSGSVINDALREVESQYQKSGKLASSGATRAMVETGEDYASSISAEAAAAELAARQAVATERNQQVSSVLGSATTLYGTETQAATDIAQIESTETLAEQELAQQQEQFEASLSASEAQFYAGLTSEEQQTYATLKNELTIATLQDATSREQFTANLAEMAREFDLTTEQTAALATEQITAQLAMNALDNETSRQNMADQLAWAKEEAYLTDQQVRDLAADALAEQAREYDHTSSIQTEQFAESLAWAKEQGYMDDATAREIAANQILEQAREYDASSELGWAQFRESCEQFDIDEAQQYDLAIQTLAIQAQSADSADLSVRLEAIADIMADALASEYFTDNQMSLLGEMIITMVDPESDITTTDDSGTITIDWTSITELLSGLTGGASDAWDSIKTKLGIT